MAQLTSTPSAFAASIFANDVDPKHNLGEVAWTSDGRAYRYVRAGGTALVVGNLLQARAEDTGEQNVAVAAAAIGATTITTTSTLTVTANQYSYVLVTVTPGLGYTYKIKSHPAATAAALTITLEEPIDVALTTSSRIDLVPNIYDGVIQCPTTFTGVPVGVAVKAISANYYGWVQVAGVANVLADGAITVGLPVVASNGTAGAVEPLTGTTLGAQVIVGHAVTGIATTENGAVRLSGLL